MVLAITVIILFIGIVALVLFCIKQRKGILLETVRHQSVFETLSNSYQALRRDYQLVEQRNETLLQVVSIIAHDVKMPLTTLRHSLYGFEKNDCQESENVFKSLGSQIDANLNLLNQLLLWASSIQDQKEIEISCYEVATVVKEELHFLEASAAKKEIGIVANCESDLMLKTNPNYVRFIIRNLLLNAIEYTPHGGKVIVSAFSKGQDVIIKVADSGIGMDAFTEPHVYAIQKVLSQNRTTQIRGFGLKVCSQFLKELGGSIQFTRERDKGTICVVCLPSEKFLH